MKNKALQVVGQISLAEAQQMVLAQPTPKQFIREKPGRGKRPVKYVEGGYVINQLNRVFGPLNWTFKVTERGETKRCNENKTEGEVWVYGELSVHDHKRGFQVTKGQYGQHPIHLHVPIGDAYKSAGTDALKKCASLFGIALDVYWGQLDTTKEQPPEEAVRYIPEEPERPRSAKPVKELSIYQRTLNYIAQQVDVQILANSIQRIEDTDTLTPEEKVTLKKFIDAKLKRLKK